MVCLFYVCITLVSRRHSLFVIVLKLKTVKLQRFCRYIMRIILFCLCIVYHKKVLFENFQSSHNGVNTNMFELIFIFTTYVLLLIIEKDTILMIDTFLFFLIWANLTCLMLIYVCIIFQIIFACIIK